MAGAVQSIKIENRGAYNAGIIRLGDGEYLVRSASNPAQAYTVLRELSAPDWRGERTVSWSCQCRGYQFRGRCRHISLARGYQSAVECCSDLPSQEEIEHFQKLEDWKEDRARRGIPVPRP